MERTCEKCSYKNDCLIPKCNKYQKFRKMLEKEIPMTNADYIRVMSDEELASLLANIVKCEYDCIMYIGENSDCIGDDYTNVIKWLQQPRKVEE